MSRPQYLALAAVHYQRGEGRARVKKTRRRMSPLVKPLALALGLSALAFFAIHGVYRFLTSWKNLDVKTIQVSCSADPVKAEIERMTREMRWGNIFRLKLNQVRTRIESCAWVKEARIRKIIPDSVKIDIVPRIPFALLQKDTWVLIDEEGRELETTSPEKYPALPSIVAKDRFRAGIQEKVGLARECLKSLPAADLAAVETLDLSDQGEIVLTFRSGPPRLILGDALFSQKIAFYRESQDRWEALFGPLEYVDLRFENRIYVKPAEAGGADPLPKPDKEAR
jgi:cell division septal protein FtsQ